MTDGFGRLRRVRRLNMPGEGEVHSGLENGVRNFIMQDLMQDYNFVINYITSSIVSIVMIEVYRQFLDEATNVYGPPIKFGVYQSVEWKRFQADIARASDVNPGSEIELAPSILYNGLFNAYPDPLDGWEIESGAQVTIKGNLGRMVITSPIAESFKVLNNKTTLENLTEYEVIVNVHKIVNNADVNILIGNTPGAVYSATGVYTENIISGGDEVIINGNLSDPDSVVELEYLIVNKNG
jgi:hypothetical protein